METRKDLQIGDMVYCGGCSGFCDEDKEKVEDISFRFDPKNGERYKIIHLSNNRLFDSRNGRAITPPIAYQIVVNL